MGGAGSRAGTASGVPLGATRFVQTLADQAAASGRPLVLDSQAIIFYLAAVEPYREVVAPNLERADVAVVVSAVTVSEVVMLPAGRTNASLIRRLRDEVVALPNLSVAAFDLEHAVETTLVRFQTGLKLPDAAVVATARLAGAIGVLGNDRRWKPMPLGVPYHHLDDVLALT